MIDETTTAFIWRISQPWLPVAEGWVGRRFKTKDIGRAGWNHWVVEAITVVQQTNLAPRQIVWVAKSSLPATR